MLTYNDILYDIECIYEDITVEFWELYAHK
jgi:hypothetical protein